MKQFGQLMDVLLEFFEKGGDSLYISRDQELTDVSSQDLFMVNARQSDGRYVRLSRTNLFQAIYAAVNGEPKRRCPKCKEMKSLFGFAGIARNRPEMCSECSNASSKARRGTTLRERVARS